MTLNRSRLNWGVFLIVLGAVPLAYNQGAVSTGTVHDLWRLWPLVLIGIGLGIVLSRTPAAFIGGLMVAACMGLVFGGILAVGPDIGCRNGDGPDRSFSRDGSFDASNSSVVLELQCGSAQVTTSPDNSWHINGSVKGEDPSIVSTPTSLTIHQRNRGDWFSDRGGDHWNLSLPSAVGDLTTTLDAGDASFTLAGTTVSRASFSVNAGSLKIDLSGAQVNNLTLSTNVGSASLILDGASNTTGRITSSVGSTDICAPAALGLRIRYSGSLASENFAAAGLGMEYGAWQTPGYDTAAYKADLTIDSSVGSVTLNPAGGCK
jgi:hypothetical protein